MTDAGPYRAASGEAPGRQLRKLPLALRARLVLGSDHGFAALITLLAGSVLFWMLATNSWLDTPTIEGPTATTQAVIDRVVHRYDKNGHETQSSAWYSYVVDGRSYRGVSYRGEGRVQDGKHPVIYQLSAPERSVLVGMQQTKNEGTMALVLAAIAVLAALILLALSWRQARRTMVLLMQGQAASHAAVTAIEPVAGRSSDRRLTIAYWMVGDDQAQRHQCRVSSWFRVEPGDPMTVLFHPADPSAAVALETLPGSPRLAGDRLLAGRRPWVLMMVVTILVVWNVAAPLFRLASLLDPSE